MKVVSLILSVILLGFYGYNWYVSKDLKHFADLYNVNNQLKTQIVIENLNTFAKIGLNGNSAEMSKELVNDFNNNIQEILDSGCNKLRRIEDKCISIYSGRQEVGQIMSEPITYRTSADIATKMRNLSNSEKIFQAGLTIEGLTFERK